MRRRQSNIKPGQKVIDGLWLHDDKDWRYRFMRKGRLYTGNTKCSDLKKARDFLADLKAFLRQEERGQVSPQPPTPPTPPPPTTLRELVELWEKTKANRSKSHLQTTAGSIKNHFGGLMDTPVETITTLAVNEALYTYTHSKGLNPGRGGKPCLRDHTARGANKLLERLRDVVRFGIKEGKVKEIHFQFERLQEEVVQKHTLRLRLTAKFFELVDRAKNPHLGMLVRLMVWMGFRESDALHLSWHGVNFETNQCLPDQSKTSDVKGGVMPPELRNYLWHHPSRKSAGLLFPSLRGSTEEREATYRPGFTAHVVQAASWKLAFDEMGTQDTTKLFSVIDAHPDCDVHTLARLILFFGLPESEARAIEWKDLDLSVGTYAMPVEGGECNVVPIHIELLNYLRSLPTTEISGRVISAPMGRHKGNGQFAAGVTTRVIADAWKTLEFYRLTPHRLRASFASIHAKELKTHIAIIQQMMRHQSITTTMTYINIDAEDLLEAQAAWPQLVDPLPQSGSPKADTTDDPGPSTDQ